jgi:hypothetical protein
VATGGVHTATVSGVVRTCVPEPDRNDFTAATAATSRSRSPAVSAPARRPGSMPAAAISWLALATRMPGSANSAVRTSILAAA